MFVSRQKIIHGKDPRLSVNSVTDMRVRGTSNLVASNIHTITAHEGDVTAVAYSNTTLATCSSDKTIRLWGIKDFTELPSSPLLGHKYFIHCCEFSPLGSTLATCSTDGTLQLWSVKTGENLVSLSHPSKCAIRVCQFSRDGTKIITGGDDETACLWNVSDKKLIRSFKGHDESVTAATFTPDDNYVVTCSSGGDMGGDMLVWDAQFGHGKFLTRVHDCHDLGVSCCAFSPTFGSAGDTSRSDSPHKFLLATGGKDNLVKLWIFTGHVGSVDVTVKLETMLPGHKDSVLWLCFSPDGQYIASCSLDRTARLWNANTQQAIISIDEHSSYVAHCAFSKDSKCLATASNDNTVKIWQLNDTSHIMQNLAGYEQGEETPGQACTSYSHVSMELWSVDDVCQWLGSLGLSEYEDKFRTNAIDGKELLAVSAADLETLGIEALGHRNKILRGKATAQDKTISSVKDEPTNTPDEFLCPITHEIMTDPVIAADGYTYNRPAIVSWMAKELRSPMTNMLLESSDLVPNRTLKMMIQKFLHSS